MKQVTASQVAAALRSLADALDKSPDAIVRKPWITFYCTQKDEFLSTAALLPRPLIKSIDNEGKEYSRYRLDHGTDTMDINCSVSQSLACHIVKPAQPAIYDCELLLSALEQETLGGAE